MGEDSSTTDYSYLFETTDRIGKKVALKEGTYTYKILPHHGEIDSGLIKDGLETATFVVEDPDYDNRRQYHKHIISPVSRKMRNLKIVVEDTYEEDVCDEVVTAYIQSKYDGDEIDAEAILYDAGTASES